MTPDEVYKEYTTEELTELIFSAMNDLDETERAYYQGCIEEAI